MPSSSPPTLPVPLPHQASESASGSLRLFGRVAVLTACSILISCGDSSERQKLESELNRKVADLQRAKTERDSLLGDLLDNTRFMNEITEGLARVRIAPEQIELHPLVISEGPLRIARQRDSIMAKIHDMTERLERSEARASSARLRVGITDPNLGNQITAYEATISGMRQRLKSQQEELIGLRASVDTLRKDNRRLSDERQQVVTERTELAHAKAKSEERLAQLTEVTGTVYIRIGTRSELLNAGIIQAEGGRRRFLGLGSKTGQTLVPNRELHESDFTRLKRDLDTVVVLPDPNSTYSIVSRHNLRYLAPITADSGVRGTFSISDPALFWLNSKFMILLRK